MGTIWNFSSKNVVTLRRRPAPREQYLAGKGAQNIEAFVHCVTDIAKEDWRSLRKWIPRGNTMKSTYHIRGVDEEKYTGREFTQQQERLVGNARTTQVPSSKIFSSLILLLFIKRDVTF